MTTLCATTCVLLLELTACATTPPPVPPPAVLLPDEAHLTELKQLTFGGENAEAYFSFDGHWLSFQAHREGEGCDRIYRMRPFERPVVPLQVSSGKGATTCAHYLPDGQSILYASTHLGGDQCPPKPDMSQGYVWALYDSYDIFTATPQGEPLAQLTNTKGYDAEATVCGKDGSIVFTSTRDGDIELYRMNKDGSNVKRLTFTPGYDGGAFFNADCTKLVWRASRPKAGKELDEFRRLLGQGLVRPTQLELYVANADGSDARQVTNLGAASFAPFWVPGEDRIVFSSNYPNPRGREFDIWAINADGTDLERITSAPGFDGFPMFSPDGQYLAFSSNRATPPGHSDTNVFIARWRKSPDTPRAPATAAERIKADVQFLAAPEREGRGIGTKGLEAAGVYLERRFTELGLRPLQGLSTLRDELTVTTALTLGEHTALTAAGTQVPRDAFTALGFSAQGTVKAPAVLAGYGIVDPELHIDDYAGLQVKGKVVVVRRFAPELAALDTPAKQRRAGDLRKKAFEAKERGAVALIIVDWPTPPADAKGWQLPAEAALPALQPEGTTGDAGLAVLAVKRAALEKVWPKLEKKEAVPMALTVELNASSQPAFNVVGVIAAGAPKGLPPLVIGAHYDHLGFGGRDSLAPDTHEPHLGADDNASGTAVLLEIARELKASSSSLPRDVVIAAFAGEESGVLGSAHLVKQVPQLAKAAAMLNLDMVGRLQANLLTVLGADSAEEWRGLLEPACKSARVDCSGSGDGYGPSDHMSFYVAGVPVLHFFTGAHGDYHKPSDTPDKLSYGGAAQVANVVVALARALPESPLTYRKVAAQQSRGDARSFGASLGTVPNYGGPGPGVKGVLLDDVRPGGGAEQGGMRKGDVLMKLGTHSIGSVEDLMFVLQSSKPGETVTAVVLRGGKEVSLQVTFQEGRRR